MSFEVNYKFYNKLENSFDYDRDNPEDFKKVYGKLEEDYSIEKLASNILQQMARRDIFIYDVEIYEFQKKKISFKQNKADLIIKNKKFSTRTGTISDLESENIEPEKPNNKQNNPLLLQPPEYNTCEVNTPLPPPTPTNSVNIAPLHNNSKANTDPRTRKIIKFVMFYPPSAVERAKFPYKFTPNKRYPVYSERIAKNGIGMTIDTIDDLNQNVKVSDELFVPVDVNLIGDQEAGFSTDKSGLSDDTLNWSGVIKDSLPKLR